MGENSAHVDALKIKYENEKILKEKYVSKKKELELKIKKCDENMKRLQEDMEILEQNETISIIKAKGYSLAYVREIIQSGVLDQEQKDETNNIKEEKQC